MRVAGLGFALIAGAAVVAWFVQLGSGDSEARVDLRAPVVEQADFSSLPEAEQYAGMVLPSPSIPGWTFLTASVLKRESDEGHFVEIRIEYQGPQTDQWLNLRVFTALTSRPVSSTEHLEIGGASATLHRQGMNGELVTISWEKAGNTYYVHAQLTQSLPLATLVEVIGSLD